RVDVQARHVEAREAGGLFVDQHDQVGAGDQDGLGAAALQRLRYATEAVGVGRIGLAVEDALVGRADERDLVRLRLDDIDAGELAPQATLNGEDRAQQRDALEAPSHQLGCQNLDDI